MAKIHAVSEGASAPAVEAVGLVKRFGATEALRGVDLSVDRATVARGCSARTARERRPPCASSPRC